MRYRRDVPVNSRAAIDAETAHVRAHLSAVTHPDDDPNARADEVSIEIVAHVDGDPALVSIIGQIDAEPDAPYLHEDYDPGESSDAESLTVSAVVTDGAAFAREYVHRMRGFGIRVDEHPGCYTRGNGLRAAYRGSLTHHTGSGFDAGFGTLLNGRADLPGPLPNVCTWADGHQTLIAAHPANHAGAAGGSWARPYPDTRLMNPLVWGDEIMYPGSVPMTLAQYRTALIGAGVAVMIAHGLDSPGQLERYVEWARLHGETSVTGKWDAGHRPGVMIDRHQFRRNIVPAMYGTDEEDIMEMIRNRYGQDKSPEAILADIEWNTWELCKALGIHQDPPFVNRYGQQKSPAQMMADAEYNSWETRQKVEERLPKGGTTG